jgi:nicotinamidase-related amidase
MKALVVIDVEKEWNTQESDYFVGDLTKLITKINVLIDECRAKSYKIIFTQHIEEEGEAFRDERAALIEALHVKEEDSIIIKHKASSFYKTTMEASLEGVDEVVVCGILTNLCVRSFVEDAYDRDLEITVIKDCCTTYDEEVQEFTFEDLKATREEVEFVELKEFVKEE